MQRLSGIIRKILFTLLFLILPTLAMAQDGLHITGIDLPEEGSKAAEAHVSVYFSLRSKQTPVTGITSDNCTLQIDANPVEIVKAEVKQFTDGERGVGVLFVIPIAKNYSEESFGIRSALDGLVKNLNRPVDMLNVVTYDTNAVAVGWSRASESALSQAINNMQNSEVLEPNLFMSFQPALTALQSLQNVSQKYLVFVSDAEGAIVGDRDKANQLIGNFTDELKKSNITPIVIAYSPDGKEAMMNYTLLQRMANNVGGAFYMAEAPDRFQQVIQRDVQNYIFGQYIYEATLNMDGNHYLEPNKYNVDFIVKTSNSEDKVKYKITWPELSKNRMWLWLTIIGIVLVGGIAAAVIVISRRNNEEEDIIDEGPQEVCCSTCGKTIPQQLYGFNGEFCLSGGLPDCPYYKMPDRGKIQITRGPMADTTFFIKKDMTTIGSYAENDIYLADKSVSRKHAAIKADEGMRYEIRDFGSSNGVYINNEKIERKFLRDGDLIRFGTVETVFKLK